MSLREQILGAKDIKSEKVEVPEWGVTVEVRGLTGKQRARIYDACWKNGRIDAEKLNPLLIIATAYDPGTGKPIFEDADRDVLSEKSASSLEQVTQVAMRLSGLVPGQLEEAEKNLLTPQSEDSTSS